MQLTGKIGNSHRRIEQRFKEDLVKLAKTFMDKAKGKGEGEILMLFKVYELAWQRKCRNLNKSTKPAQISSGEFTDLIMGSALYNSVMRKDMKMKDKYEYLRVLDVVQQRGKLVYYWRKLRLWMRSHFLQRSYDGQLKVVHNE